MFCLLIFLSLFSAYSTKVMFPEMDLQSLADELNKIANKEENTKPLNAKVNYLNTPETLKSRDLDLIILEFMDENGDGILQYSEFVKFQIQHMNAAYNQKHKPQKRGLLRKVPLRLPEKSTV